MSAGRALAAALEAEGGLIGAALEPGAAEGAGEAPATEMELVVEAVREGHLLHLGRPRLVTRADEDLALLAGDRLYALGLAKLAALGDLDAVAVLADLISACARAQAEGRPEAAEEAWSQATPRLLREVAH